MEEQSFRVLLDFTEMNLTVTKITYVWMYISPRELRNIQDLKLAISRRFPFIQESFRLFVRDGLLLESEKIAVLREGDTVKLQCEDFPFDSYTTQTAAIENFVSNEPSEESVLSKEIKKRGRDVLFDQDDETNSSKRKKKRKREKSNKSILSEETVNDQESISNNALEMLNQTGKKHKDKQVSNVNQEEIVLHNVSEITNDSNNKSKRKQYKELSSQEISTNNLCNCDKTSKNSCSCGVTNKVIKITDDTFSIALQAENAKNLNNPDHKNDSFDIVSMENDPKQEIACKKRKRKRKRKRKEQKNLEEPCLIENSESCQNFDIPEANQFSNTGKRVIYNSSEMLITAIEKGSSTKTSSLDSSIEEAKHNSPTKEVKSQDISSSNKSDNHPKISTPVSKKLQRMESWSITPLIKKLKEQTSFLPSVETNNLDKEVADKRPYDDYPPLTFMPVVGTHMAYKTLELSENYCPEVTDYKEGIIRNVNPETQDLEIELIQEEIKPAKTGKFEVYYDFEVRLPEVVKNVTINWSAMIDPKVISGVACPFTDHVP